MLGNFYWLKLCSHGCNFCDLCCVLFSVKTTGNITQAFVQTQEVLCDQIASYLEILFFFFKDTGKCLCNINKYAWYAFISMMSVEKYFWQSLRESVYFECVSETVCNRCLTVFHSRAIIYYLLSRPATSHWEPSVTRLQHGVINAMRSLQKEIYCTC